MEASAVGLLRLLVKTICRHRRHRGPFFKSLQRHFSKQQQSTCAVLPCITAKGYWIISFLASEPTNSTSRSNKGNDPSHSHLLCKDWFPTMKRRIHTHICYIMDSSMSFGLLLHFADKLFLLNRFNSPATSLQKQKYNTLVKQRRTNSSQTAEFPLFCHRSSE